MGVFFYNIFLILYKAGIRIASLFNPKAKKWLEGRKNIFEKIRQSVQGDQKIIWMHCASLGEFEQGRPVIEQLGKLFPGHRVLITFFSPSGFEVRKNYEGADWVFYLPMDGALNAKKFIETVKPALVIFVKYEFWYYYLKKLRYRNIPVILISAIFRPHMAFFKWHGAIQRKMLTRFESIFVQDEESQRLLLNAGITDHVFVSGDTRFDRVSETASSFTPVSLVEKFKGTSKLIVAGSTWKEDEELLARLLPALKANNTKLVIAPHEIDNKHLSLLGELFPSALFYSSFKDDSDQDVLIIDNIGMLSRLYYYADVCFVGGGLSPTGIHNVLEAAVYSKPVLFGPNYQQYNEAKGLLSEGGAWSMNDNNDEDGIRARIIKLLTDDSYRKKMGDAAGEYVRTNTGATQKIIRYIQEKRLLTN